MQANTDLQHTLLSHSMPHLARVQRDVRIPSEPTPATPTLFQDPLPMVHAFPTAPEPVQLARADPIAEVIATLQAGLEALRTNPKSSEPCPPKLDTSKKKAEQSNASSAVTQSSARKRTSTPSPGKASAM